MLSAKKRPYILLVDDFQTNISFMFCGLGTMTMRNAAGERELYKGSLYSLEVDGSVRKHKGEITVSNGLAWSADNTTMYYIDSHPRKVYAYDFDLDSGTLSKYLK